MNLVDKLDKCPWCNTKLGRRLTNNGYPIFDCPNEESHIKQGRLWAWYREAGLHISEMVNIISINVEQDNMQLCFKIDLNEMEFIYKRSGFGRQHIVIDELIDIDFTIESIKNKMNMIVNFI